MVLGKRKKIAPEWNGNSLNGEDLGNVSDFWSKKRSFIILWPKKGIFCLILG